MHRGIPGKARLSTNPRTERKDEGRFKEGSDEVSDENSEDDAETGFASDEETGAGIMSGDEVYEHDSDEEVSEHDSEEEVSEHTNPTIIKCSNGIEWIHHGKYVETHDPLLHDKEMNSLCAGRDCDSTCAECIHDSNICMNIADTGEHCDCPLQHPVPAVNLTETPRYFTWVFMNSVDHSAFWYMPPLCIEENDALDEYERAEHDKAGKQELRRLQKVLVKAQEKYAELNKKFNAYYGLVFASASAFVFASAFASAFAFASASASASIA
jgi:hypothetical protein